MGEKSEEDQASPHPGETDQDIESVQEETALLLENGPAAGNRSGAFAFLAFLVLAAAVVHFYLAESGAGAYINQLDSDLLKDANLTLAAMEEGGRMAVVPSWPYRLYAVLRRDLAIYVALSAVAAYIWGLSARARARRAAYLVHEKLTAEIAALRERLDKLDSTAGDGKSGPAEDKKG